MTPSGRRADVADELWIPGKTAMFFIGGAIGTAVAVAIGFMALMAIDTNVTTDEPPTVTTGTGATTTTTTGDTTDTTGATAGATLELVDSVDSTLTLIGTEFAYDPRDSTVTGPFELELVNEGLVVHNIVFEGIDDFEINANPGRTESEKIRLEPGSYVIFCSIAGHREAGMEGSITVEG